MGFFSAGPFLREEPYFRFTEGNMWNYKMLGLQLFKPLIFFRKMLSFRLSIRQTPFLEIVVP